MLTLTLTLPPTPTPTPTLALTLTLAPILTLTLTLTLTRWGKTPVTWYSELGWESARFDMLSFAMAAPPGRTHRYYTGTPQFPFGSGLSYAPTALRAHAATAATDEADGDGGVGRGSSDAVVVTVTNQHPTRATDEVARRRAIKPAPTQPPHVNPGPNGSSTGAAQPSALRLASTTEPTRSTAPFYREQNADR